jgi:nitrate reductase cytochrome c-type subunit
LKMKELSFLGLFILVLIAAIGSSKLYTASQEAVVPKTQTAGLIQLNEDGRQDAATMQLISPPPTQPADHINRWNPELRHESCLACHGVEGTGAPTPSKNHFYEENTKGKIFRDNCIQCHVTQNDKKPAFNREK